jgi:hypothetical protein
VTEDRKIRHLIEVAQFVVSDLTPNIGLLWSGLPQRFDVRYDDF